MRLEELLQQLNEIQRKYGNNVDVEFTFTEIKNDHKTCWSRHIQEMELFDFSWKDETKKILAITLK